MVIVAFDDPVMTARALVLHDLEKTGVADPAAVYADSARRDAYLKMYGNICYDTRDQYVNFPWSSEAKM